MSGAVVYLIPSFLDENSIQVIPGYITEAIKKCTVIFAENERSARRYLKQLWRTCLPGQEIIIDAYEWFVITKDNVPASVFRQKIREGKIIGIISEAGCPGVADPGQELISIAHEMNVNVKPLVGPSAVLLALMASGMNGQQFKFNGYLPLKEPGRAKAIKELEAESAIKNCTQIFIETPYRNNQLVESVLKNCKSATQLCIAADITGAGEWIKKKTIIQWRNEKPDLHKRPAIFLLYAS